MVVVIDLGRIGAAEILLNQELKRRLWRIVIADPERAVATGAHSHFLQAWLGVLQINAGKETRIRVLGFF